MFVPISTFPQHSSHSCCWTVSLLPFLPLPTSYEETFSCLALTIQSKWFNEDVQQPPNLQEEHSVHCFAACWSGTESPDIGVTVLNFAGCCPRAQPWQAGGRDRLRLTSFQKSFLTWRIFHHSESVPSFFAYCFRLQHPVINSVPTQAFQ